MADAVTRWNDVLLKVIRQVGGFPGPVSRGGAMMHGAIYDAVNSIAPSTHRPYLVSVPATPGASIQAAVAYAASDALAAAFPTFPAAALDAERDAALVGAAGDVGAGKVVGKAAAKAIIDDRVGDGSDDTSPYTPGMEPGDWRPTGSGPAATPYWSDVKPFAIPAGNAFRPPRPGGYPSKPVLLKSSEYAAQFNEVKQLGRYNSATRTPEQTAIAFFWANDIDGTYKPPGQLLDITKVVSEQKGVGIAANARLFALAAFAIADAAIVAWDAKFETSIDLWRPETAIRLAGTDGNPATAADVNWQPLSADAANVHFSPPFPAYISGHATLSAAHAAVMRRFFGTDNVTFTATTQDPHAVGVTRTFNSFTAAALEAARSRVYLGVHFQWDGDNGFLSGSAAGEYVYGHVLTPIGD